MVLVKVKLVDEVLLDVVVSLVEVVRLVDVVDSVVVLDWVTVVLVVPDVLEVKVKDVEVKEEENMLKEAKKQGRIGRHSYVLTGQR